MSMQLAIKLQHWRYAVLAVGIILLLFGALPTVFGQNESKAFAEAIGQANLRSGPAVSYSQIGQISVGTKYPIVARSAKFPWYLIALPTGQQGWVYKDLVKLTGDLGAVPISEAEINTPIAATVEPVNTQGPVAAVNTDAPAAITNAPAATLTPTSQLTADTGVYIEAVDSLNVRYGPGTDFPRIGTINKGTKYPVLRRHTQFLWLEIAFPEVAGGRGWVFRSAVTVTGDVNSVPTTSESDFGYPTLTPTPAMVVTSVPVWTVTPAAALSDHLATLSNAIYDYMLSKHFEPGTDKVGSAFLMDLQTGERYSLNPGLAYSGMSLIKIPILVSLYRKVRAIPTVEQANLIGLMIICSENAASNQLLSYLGDGDIYRGADYVTATMQTLGLKDTFLVGPLTVDKPAAGPTPTLVPIQSLTTTADQISTDPDRFNQTTPSDLGWLLAGIYQCALDGTGPLPAVFPDQLTMQKCRGIVRTLRADNIPAMLRAGVPDGIQVAHKHGWVNEVHGDAGIVSTPGGDYVLVVMLRNKKWLNYEDSFPTIAEISRMVYNTYNPATALAQTHTQPVPQCDLGSIDPRLFVDLRSGSLPPIR
ncbi:MAG: serine hydrolase [Chloroflexota bacterium]